MIHSINKQTKTRGDWNSPSHIKQRRHKKRIRQKKKEGGGRGRNVTKERHLRVAVRKTTARTAETCFLSCPGRSHVDGNWITTGGGRGASL